MKFLLVSLLVGAASCISSVFLQCDSQWGNDLQGHYGGENICKIGGGLSSIASLLKKCDQGFYGFDVNPGSLNKWLKENNGYSNGDQIVWNKIDNIYGPIEYVTTTSNVDSIKYYIDRGDAALLKVSARPHYVLSTSYASSHYNVLDPRDIYLSYQTYEVSEAVIFTYPSWCKS